MKTISDIIILAVAAVVIGASTKAAIFLFNVGYNLF
jgi:hypothetical protein